MTEQDLKKKKDNKVLMIVLIVLGVLMIASVGSCIACVACMDKVTEDTDEQESQDDNETSEVEQEEIVDYKIIEEDDVSYAGYSRWSVRVVFSESTKKTLTEKQFKGTGEKIVNDFIDKKGKVDEVNLFCYLEGQDYTGAYSVGKIVAKKESNYSIVSEGYSFNYKVPDESELGGLSMSKQKSIYYDVIKYQRKSDDPSVWEKTYGVVAKEYKTTEKIVLEICSRGGEEAWPKPPLE